MTTIKNRFCQPIKIVSEDEAEDRIANSDKPVVIRGFSDDCGACIESGPMIQQASCDHRDDVEILAVNVDRYPDFAERHKIEMLPTVTGYFKGKQVKQTVGANGANGYSRFFAALAKFMK